MRQLPGQAVEAQVDEATRRAEELLVQAGAGITWGERRRRDRLARLLADPDGRELLFTLTDQVLRFPGADRSMRRLRALVAGGLSPALSLLDRSGLRLAALGSRRVPTLTSWAVRARLRAEVRGVILPAADRAIGAALGQRTRQGFDVNVNLLGEAIVGDREAATRLTLVSALLRRPDVAHVSVKVTALCANLDVLAFDDSVARLADPLRRLFRVAMEATPSKMVHLDMEEYHDLALTLAAFERVLGEPEFHHLPAGIALQAYLPDSHAALEELCRFARARRRAGGSWIRVRLVKGANLAMEQVQAELSNWVQAPYATKAEVDASFKRMLAVAIDAGAPADLHIGVGSHNLFDVAWALGQRQARAEGRLEIEMLEGMAPAQSRAVKGAAGHLLLYAPVVSEEDFAASIAYLSRRLDENTGPDNFLRALLSLTPGSPGWEAERHRFVASLADRHTVSTAPRRRQNRLTEVPAFEADAPFANEADTDFSLVANRKWITAHLRDDRPDPLPPLVTERRDVEAAVATAAAAASRWAATPTGERRRLLARAAEVMAAGRGRTLAVMAHETGKTVAEGDAEVSEAIDHARWAAGGSRALDALEADGLRCDPVGPVVVAGPWNFPYAIPANGVASALAAGNPVLLKPAPEAVATGVELVHQLHQAGVPPDVLQLVRCPDDEVGQALICDERVGTVVLTGSFETAALFQDWKPSLRLLAETSGKNALVITASADQDLAIADLVHSAFGHAGQKCSAASLAILEADLYDDRRFLGRLADAVSSIRVGPATRVESMIGPLIHPPAGPLLRALTTLEEGESWLVEPRQLDDEGYLWRPGVKLGVAPGSWFHRTECFGPVLGVMRAHDLAHALTLQNESDFGLTGGLHSLDPDEIGWWLDRVQVGNAYVNRHITGAVVRRQPFGGWKRSAVGPTAKAGGPDYLLRLVRPRPAGRLPIAASAVASYRHWWAEVYGSGRDASGLRAESNVLRHLPVAQVVVRAAADTPPAQIGLLREAAGLCGTPLELSVPPGGPLAGPGVVEEDSDLARRIGSSGAERLRVLGPLGDELLRACHAHHISVDDTPVTGHGRVELPCWLREQSVSRTLHRHGRVAGP